MKGKSESASTSTGSTTTTADKGNSPVYDELLGYYEKKIAALRKTRDTLETAKPVLTPPATPPGGQPEQAIAAAGKCRALLAMELLSEMVEDIAMDLVFETHFELKQRLQTTSNGTHLSKQQLSSRSTGQANGSNASDSMTPDMFGCPNCQRHYPAARFASHMDKCMGLSSRRTTTRR